MKKIPFIFVLMLFLVFFSCKTAPEASFAKDLEEPVVPVSEPSADEYSAPETVPVNENISVDESASIVVLEEAPAMDEYQADLLEPLLDFPEENPSEIPDTSENPSSSLIPPDDLPPEVPNDLQDDTNASSQMSSETQSAPNAESSEPEPIPPLPPAFLRPAEPVVDDTIVREAIPMPVNSVPALPSQPNPPLAEYETEDNIDFSRTVRATVGQLIEIPFRGSGWVFLGEIGSRNGISYDSRRIDPEGQSFIFRAEQKGTYILKFYKEDYIRDYILNDHVQVIIGEAPEPAGTGWFNPPSDWSRVIAEPRWPATENQNVPANASESNAPQSTPDFFAPEAVPLPTSDSSVLDEGIIPVIPPLLPNFSAENVSETEIQNGDSAAIMPMPENAAPEDYFQKAQEAFDAGRIAEAISILEQFRQFFPSGSDEAFWLLGQFYEANSPSRDIRTSLDYYQRLVNAYPQSKRYSSAKARIAYLERFYLNLR